MALQKHWEIMRMKGGRTLPQPKIVTAAKARALVKL